EINTTRRAARPRRVSARGSGTTHSLARGIVVYGAAGYTEASDRSTSHFPVGRPAQPNARPEIRPERPIDVRAITRRENRRGPRPGSRSVPRSPLAAQA